MIVGSLEHGVFLRRYVSTLTGIVKNIALVVEGLMSDADTIVGPPVRARFEGRNAHDYALMMRMVSTYQEWDQLLLDAQGHC